MKNDNFSDLKLVEKDEIFKLLGEFNKDKRHEKINGAIGVYLDEKGKFYVHKSIQSAIKYLNFFNFNYLPISGDPDFLKESLKLILGEELYRDYGNYFAEQGVIGGTDGLYIWGCLIKKTHKKPKIIISNPTWENHKKIFKFLGFDFIEYYHLDRAGNLNLKSLQEAIYKNPKVYILLQGGPTHNPTGVNPNSREWSKLADQIKEKELSVLFDAAYLGMGENLTSDSYPIRLFIRKKIPCSVNISYSKNMTLYQHRVGALFVSATSKKEKEIIKSHLQAIFRIVNSNPAAFGEFIVKTVLESRELNKIWFNELSKMAESLNRRRRLFANMAGNSFHKVVDQKGLFSLLGLKPKKIELLKKKYGIYLLKNSRVNFGGVSASTIPVLANAVSEINTKYE